MSLSQVCRAWMNRGELVAKPAGGVGKLTLPPEKTGEPPLLQELRRGPGAALASPEYLAWHKSLTEVGDVTTLGDRPLIVITAGDTFGGFKDVMFPV